MAPGVGFHSRTRDAPVSPPQVFPTEPNRGSSFPGSRTRTMSSVAQGAVRAATRACFTESRRPQSRRAQSAPRSGRVAGRRRRVGHRPARPRLRGGRGRARGDGTRGRAVRAAPPRTFGVSLRGRFRDDRQREDGQLVRRGFRVTDAARFGGAVNNNAVSVFSLKARDGSPRGTVPGTTFPGTTVPGRFRDVADVSSSATSAPAGAFAEATAFAAETYAFEEDGSRRRVRRGRDQAQAAPGSGDRLGGRERTNERDRERGRRRGRRRDGKKEKKRFAPRACSDEKRFSKNRERF